MNHLGGAWIFLSHSTRDWEKVRLVRNHLEEKGHKPLVFFLKCLTEKSELDDLIKREIEARKWFLLCDSKNARQSIWVQEEVAYIKSMEKKHYEKINLHDSLESQIERIKQLCRRLTIFVSYARADEVIAFGIQEALIKEDYSVWRQEDDVIAGVSWRSQISSAIDAAVNHGFVLVMLSPASVRSEWFRHESRHALEKSVKAPHGANVVPIMLHDPDITLAAMPVEFQRLFRSVQWLDFSHGPLDENIQGLIAHLMRRQMD